jgi:hypothetical protein
MGNQLQNEIARRIADGRRPSTMAEIRASLRAIGYELAPYSAADSMARGPNGVVYPVRTYAVREADTKISAFHYRDARRDANYAALQGLRLGAMYAVVRGRIMEF